MNYIKTTLSVLMIVVAVSFPNEAKTAEIGDYLFPQPKKLSVQKGQFSFPQGRITGKTGKDDRMFSILQDLQQAFIHAAAVYYPIAATAAPGEDAVISISISENMERPQGYDLKISESNIVIKGKDEAALFYAVLTLKQLLKLHNEHGAMPLVTLSDWPDFAQRGVMLDISRDKVPTMESLYQYIDQLAAWKINEIQLYTEHTFAYINHKSVWENASPMTAEQILLLDQYCRKRFITLTPNQNSFAHMNRWLDHEEYKHLSEADKGDVISPAEPGSLILLDGLYRELLPNFTSEYFNIGCDETEFLGTGKSKAMADKIGKGRLYLNFLLDLDKLVKKNNRKTQFWGDIIINHPELIPELPRDMTAMVWGYQPNHPYDKQCATFKNAKIDFYVCPGTSSWNTIMGKNKIAFGNLKNAAINGKKYGAKGFLNTDWGDQGHWQPLTVSQPAYLYGAGLSWGVDENINIDIAHCLNMHFFGDQQEVFGEALIALGNAYQEVAPSHGNNNFFHMILKDTRIPVSQNKSIPETNKEKLQHAIDFIEKQITIVNRASIINTDAVQIKEEMTLAAKMCQHACKQLMYKMETADGDIKSVPAGRKAELRKEFEQFITRFQELWLVRNRPGGLQDSVNRMKDYVLNYY